MEINELPKQVHANAIEHGWWHEDRNVGELLALVHSEVSEALEEWRDGRMDIYFIDTSCREKPCGFYSELADVVIRVADIFAAHEKDLEHELLLKMNYNKNRTYRHGGKQA